MLLAAPSDGPGLLLSAPIIRWRHGKKSQKWGNRSTTVLLVLVLIGIFMGPWEGGGSRYTKVPWEGGHPLPIHMT